MDRDGAPHPRLTFTYYRLPTQMPHRADTAMVDVRDCAAAHVAAARLDGAAGHRFVLSSPKVGRTHCM